MFKEIIKKLEEGQEWIEFQNPDRIIRFAFSSKEDVINEDIPPDCIESSTYEKQYDLLILSINKSKLSIHYKDEKFGKIKEASEPLIKYLNENYHPHVTAIVTLNKCEIVEGLITHVTDEFIKN